MSYTLLELTTQILSSMDSDEVTSISDTTEATQVANIIRSTYFDIITRAQLPEHFSLFSLTASGDNTKPTLMSVPTSIAKINWIKYDKQTTADTTIRYTNLDYLKPEVFLDRMYMIRSTDTNAGSFSHIINGSTIKFLYRNDLAPCVWTTFDDATLVFDSYDHTVDTTLQASKTVSYGRLIIPFTLSDSFTPDLDDDQFPLLLNESKALAWAELKQTEHAKAERNAHRQWSALQNTQNRAKQTTYFDDLPNYGRRR